ncbi:hypothetical protein NHJ13734_002673 [Beauveria thailandica]
MAASGSGNSSSRSSKQTPAPAPAATARVLSPDLLAQTSNGHGPPRASRSPSLGARPRHNGPERDGEPRSRPETAPGRTSCGR